MLKMIGKQNFYPLEVSENEKLRENMKKSKTRENAYQMNLKLLYESFERKPG